MEEGSPDSLFGEGELRYRRWVVDVVFFECLKNGWSASHVGCELVLLASESKLRSKSNPFPYGILVEDVVCQCLGCQSKSSKQRGIYGSNVMQHFNQHFGG